MQSFLAGCIRQHGDAECQIIHGQPLAVLRLAEELDLSGLWGFTYTETCSRPRIEAFGGGAHVICLGVRKSIGWIQRPGMARDCIGGGGDLGDLEMDSTSTPG